MDFALILKFTKLNYNNCIFQVWQAMRMDFIKSCLRTILGYDMIWIKTESGVSDFYTIIYGQSYEN